MEILKKPTVLAFSVLLTFTSIQETKDLQSAFATSYTLEYSAKYTDAITELKKVYDPSSYETNLRLGWLCYEAKDYANACTYYKTASNLLPMSIEAKMGYVLPLAALSKWDDVILQYKSILKMDNYNSTVNYRMGLIYYNRKDYPTAKIYLDNAINTYPFDYDIVSLTAWNDVMLGKKDDAKILFNKVLLIRPTDTTAVNALKNL